jgi:signal transduction histidine kinase
VTISVARRASRAALVVEDDGPGIPEPQREAVFERFYRGSGGAASGSGLGLAIAREMARLMHGAVRLESKPGRTLFTLELPAVVSADGHPFSREIGRPTTTPRSS